MKPSKSLGGFFVYIWLTYSLYLKMSHLLVASLYIICDWLQTKKVSSARVLLSFSCP